MNHIDRTIARIPSMDAKARAALRRNAGSTLRKSPSSLDAQRIMDALDAFETAQPKASRFDITGLLAWEKFRHGETTFRAFHGDDLAGRIFMRANHSGTEKDVYSIEILGQVLPGDWHHIADARAAGEAAFAEKREK